MADRAERRRNTEQRILDSARRLFAERGFERTTIRAVAAAAEVDPALVMQYFESKQNLFAAAVHAAPDPDRPGGPPELTDSLLTALGIKIAGMPATSLAMLRSMLTHPDAADSVRTALDRQVEQVAGAIKEPDAELRAALVISAMVGITIGHQLLDLDAFRGATSERIIELLRPAVQSLVEG